MINILLKSLQHTFVIVVLYIVTYYFYNIEIIKSRIEDFAFDLTVKLVYQKKIDLLEEPNVFIFGFDEYYMKSKNLLNENNRTTFGYLFPRDKLAQFIERLDKFTQDISSYHQPKVLFVDYDLSFSSLPYGKKLSAEDKQLIEVLKHQRNYKILLPKTRKANIVQDNHDIVLQKRIQEGKIIFVSVSFLKSHDNKVRRYLAYQLFNNDATPYPNVNVAIWEMMQRNTIDVYDIQNTYQQKDIVANRMIVKDYKFTRIDNNCAISQSYWNNMFKYSANYSFYDIPEEDFANAVLLLGDTQKNADDKLQIFGIDSFASLSGIELHANTLMSLFYFNGQLQRLSFWKQILLITSIVLILNIIIRLIFIKFHVKYETIQFYTILSFISICFISISIYLLITYQTWFNWMIPVAILYLYRYFLYVVKLPWQYIVMKRKINNV